MHPDPALCSHAHAHLLHSLAAHAALEQALPGAPRRLLLVDVLDSLEPTIRRLARLNRVPPSALRWHAGYVTGGSTRLSKDEALSAAHNLRMYEKVWLTGPGSNQTSPALTLAQLFRQHLDRIR